MYESVLTLQLACKHYILSMGVYPCHRSKEGWSIINHYYNNGIKWIVKINSAFSLIEIIAVIAIVGLLAAIEVPMYNVLDISRGI